MMIRRLLAMAILMGGFAFWVYNPSNNCLYMEGQFQNYPDCQTMRGWMAAQPTPAASPQASPAMGLTVSPSCYYMVNL